MDFAPNYTHRIKVRYFACGAAHSQVWRSASNDGLVERTGAFNTIQAYYDALQALLSDDLALLSISEAAANSDIFLPSPFTLSLVGTADYSTFGPSKKASSTSFVGRSVAGLRAIIYQYGIVHSMASSETPSNDFRVTRDEVTEYGDAIDALNAAVGMVANDDFVIVWYPYVNAKYNDYWLRRVRVGA